MLRRARPTTGKFVKDEMVKEVPPYGKRQGKDFTIAIPRYKRLAESYHKEVKN
jgi:hypothetical protein